jgi:hypothetical protein
LLKPNLLLNSTQTTHTILNISLASFAHQESNTMTFSTLNMLQRWLSIPLYNHRSAPCIEEIDGREAETLLEQENPPQAQAQRDEAI